MQVKLRCEILQNILFFSFRGVIFLNYIGSKLSLIDFVVDSIDQVCGQNDGSFADLFAGSENAKRSSF